MKDLASRGEVGRIDPHDHAADEAVDQRFAEFLDHLGMAVAGHDDLAAHRFDRVEGVQEFFLRRLFAAQEMHIVDDQKIELAHLPAENVQLVGLQGGRNPLVNSSPVRYVQRLVG